MDKDCNFLIKIPYIILILYSKWKLLKNAVIWDCISESVHTYCCISYGQKLVWWKLWNFTTNEVKFNRLYERTQMISFNIVQTNLIVYWKNRVSTFLLIFFLIWHSNRKIIFRISSCFLASKNRMCSIFDRTQPLK